MRNMRINTLTEFELAVKCSLDPGQCVFKRSAVVLYNRYGQRLKFLMRLLLRSDYFVSVTAMWPEFTAASCRFEGQKWSRLITIIIIINQMGLQLRLDIRWDRVNHQRYQHINYVWCLMFCFTQLMHCEITAV